jgi:1-acyl-sn-glycerol-3-phosphate acyltransferase
MSARRGGRLIKPSSRLMALFHLYLRWFVGRHFHGLRVANGERFPRSAEGPTIIYLNHPSWWDPLTCILISRYFLPRANHYAPMDEAALRRYRFFARLGLFPVEMNTARGAIQFLRASTEVLSTPEAVLWLTPQGHFADVRKRPLILKDGLASLLARLPKATVFPLTIEYVYWDERLPEILVNCGAPIRLPIHTSDGGECMIAEWNATLATALTATQDDLAALAVTRDPSNFESIIEGSAGIGVIYDLWQRMRSGARYDPEHGSIHRP